MIRSAVERLSPFASEQGLPLDGTAIDRIAAVIGLLEVWNRKTRLTGDRDVETLVSKHCADSIVAAAELAPQMPVLDIGSGAGFPGLVAACLRPEVPVTLVDSRQKACSFLDAAAARASLRNVRVLNARVEDVASAPPEMGRFSVAMSRGVNLGDLVPTLRDLLVPSGEILVMLSGRQDAPADALHRAGFAERTSRSYRLPTGEDRRIVRYAPA